MPDPCLNSQIYQTDKRLCARPGERARGSASSDKVKVRVRVWVRVSLRVNFRVRVRVGVRVRD